MMKTTNGYVFQDPEVLSLVPYRPCGPTNPWKAEKREHGNQLPYWEFISLSVLILILALCIWSTVRTPDCLVSSMLIWLQLARMFIITQFSPIATLFPWNLLVHDHLLLSPSTYFVIVFSPPLLWFSRCLLGVYGFKFSGVFRTWLGWAGNLERVSFIGKTDLFDGIFVNLDKMIFCFVYFLVFYSGWMDGWIWDQFVMLIPFEWRCCFILLALFHMPS
jgi:hypothetical protein